MSSPPNWLFKVFGTQAPANVRSNIQLLGIDSFTTRRIQDADSAIEVEASIAADQNAGLYILAAEGNLRPTGTGSGTPPLGYWAAKAKSSLMTAYRPMHGNGYAPFQKTAVSPQYKEDAKKGPGIRINNNDTDPNGEDDLIEVKIVRRGSPALALHRSAGTIKIWKETQKTNRVVP